jgi:uncharacterized membrane protein YqjE
MPMMDTARSTPEGAASITAEVLTAARILRTAGGELCTQAALHGELARIEWAAEKQRLLRRLSLLAVGFALGACALLALGALALVLAWETPWRVTVAAALPLVYLGLAALAAWRLQVDAANSGPAFAATRQELAADLALLRSRL